MHLLRVADLTFEEVSSQGPFPEYAILSHTWISPSSQEVTFQDIRSHGQARHDRAFDSARIATKTGWRKISYTISQAKNESLDYVWIDTCCINKQDPTELGEAINCMFNWYRSAAVCYVYIPDADVCQTHSRLPNPQRSNAIEEATPIDSTNSFSPGCKRFECHSDTSVSTNESRKRLKRADSVIKSTIDQELPEGGQEHADTDIESLFRRTRWIERGWTLQELLAPPVVHFYDASWTPVTTRSESARVLSQITGIDESALQDMTVDTTTSKGSIIVRDPRPALHQYSVAQRMSWAADRKTTRAEDRAYSLLGLFGVRMPLFYGEGEESAFRRLQEEIIKASSDQSLFAWACPDHAAGLLAPDPACFRLRSHVVPRPGTSAFKPRRQKTSSTSYFMCNRGLEISLPMLSTRLGWFYQAILHCRDVNDPARVFLLNLYHIEDNEYCVMEGDEPRCIDVHHRRLPAPDTIEKQPIIIRRSWAEFATNDRTVWELNLRLDDLVGSSERSGGLAVHSAFPTEYWSKDMLHYKRATTTAHKVAPDGASAICISYEMHPDDHIKRYLFLVFTHKEVLGRSLLSLHVGEGALDSIDDLRASYQHEESLQCFVNNNYHCVRGYMPLHSTLLVQDGTSFRVGLQEVELFGDVFWELNIARHGLNDPQIKTLPPTAYQAIFDEGSVRMERLEYVPLDDSWMSFLPRDCAVISALGHGSSYWSQTGKIEVRLEDGSIKEYFIKLTKTNNNGKLMTEGEYESMRLLRSISPELVPHPVGHGSLINQEDTHFFLSEYVSMHDRVPSMRDFCNRVASLHIRSQAYSQNGQYGFHVTTCNGTFPQYTKWNTSWERFFIETLQEAFVLEEQAQGFSQEIADLLPALLEKVCPRLLRPLETEGRTIRPVLVHGDLWDKNTGVLTATGVPCIFDSSALWAHNEYELHSWRGDKFKIGTDFAEEYFKHFPISEPETDWEDRNLLYALMTELHDSYLFRGTDKFRRFLIDNMKTLVDKFPNGYQGEARCKADE